MTTEVKPINGIMGCAIDTTEQWNLHGDLVLKVGQLGLEIETPQGMSLDDFLAASTPSLYPVYMKIGDGRHEWDELPYYLDQSVPMSSTTVSGLIKTSTQELVEAGTDGTTAVTPSLLQYAKVAEAADLSTGHVLAGKTTAEAVRSAIEAPSPNVGKHSSVQITHATGQPLANNVAATVLTTSTATGPLNVSHLSGQACWRIQESGVYRLELELPVFPSAPTDAVLSVSRVRYGEEVELYYSIDGMPVGSAWVSLKTTSVYEFNAGDDVVFKVRLINATGIIHSAYGRATITRLR
jgi:hypothetical protein